jgi:hypothetical protein
MKMLELKPGAVTDRTPELLWQAGWRCDRATGWWSDPRTGEWYAITQAEAIRQNRATPRYGFRQSRQNA